MILKPFKMSSFSSNCPFTILNVNKTPIPIETHHVTIEVKSKRFFVTQMLYFYGKVVKNSCWRDNKMMCRIELIFALTTRMLYTRRTKSEEFLKIPYIWMLRYFKRRNTKSDIANKRKLKYGAVRSHGSKQMIRNGKRLNNAPVKEIIFKIFSINSHRGLFRQDSGLNSVSTHEYQVSLPSAILSGIYELGFKRASCLYTPVALIFFFLKIRSHDHN